MQREPKCVRCGLDRQAHLEGAPGSCSRFRLIRLRAPAGSQPTTRERIWNETTTKGKDE